MAALLWLVVLSSLVSSTSAGRLASDIADSMAAHGFEAEAVSEYRRALFLSRADSSVDVPLTRLRLGLALGSAGAIEDAIAELHLARDMRTSLAAAAQLAAAGFRARQFNYELAQAEVSDLLVFSRESLEAGELRRYVAWLNLQQGDFVSGAAEYASAGDSTLAERVSRSPAAGTRNANLAMLMSTAIPGTGEMYAGRPAAGLLALAVTGLTVAGTVLAARSDDWVSASVMASAFFWRFYNGSRQNAAVFADEHNRAARSRRLSQVAIPDPDWFGPANLAIGRKAEPDTATTRAMSGSKQP